MPEEIEVKMPYDAALVGFYIGGLFTVEELTDSGTDLGSLERSFREGNACFSFDERELRRDGDYLHITATQAVPNSDFYQLLRDYAAEPQK